MNHERSTSPDYAKTYARIYPLAKAAIAAASVLRVNGGETLPGTQAIYAANHNSVMDPLWLAAAYYGQAHEPLRFLAKQGYFDGKGIDDKGKYGRTIQKLVTATGQIPVDREKGRSDGSIDAAVAALDDGISSVGIFPEGTLSEYGQLGKLHAGIARIALRAEGNVPIVPVAILPQGKHLGRPVISVNFGAPIDVSRYSTTAWKLVPEFKKAKLITDDLEERLAALTGYSRTGKYAKPGEVRRRRALEK